jgi:tetratricopeptide (TPR) repeat protein
VFFQQSISLSDAVEDEYGMLESCLLAGWQASSVGQFVEEKEWYEQGLALSRKVENPWAENIALINYGVVLQRLGSYEAADEALKDAILKSNIFENELSLALALFEVGCLYLSLGHLETAIDSLAHSIEISEEYGLLIRLRSLACLTWVLWHSGRFKDAEYAIKNVIKTDVRSVFNQNYFDAYITWLELLVLTGCYQAAREEILRIDNVMISKQYKFNDWQGGYINFVQGLLAVEKKDYSSAKKFMQDCWDKVSVFIPHVNRFQFIYALIAFEEGNFEQFKIIVINALKTSIENQDYMSMINHLPLTLILLEGKNREFELEIFKKVMCDPFLGKAQLFHDLVYNHLPEKIRSIEVEMVETSPEHREELWAVARKVLESWRDS